jgi:hypothetical protein
LDERKLYVVVAAVGFNYVGSNSIHDESNVS